MSSASNDLFNPAISDPQLDVMNFLNEIALQYPYAVSLASGSPYSDFFDLELWHDYFNHYIEQLPATSSIKQLGQYGPSQGIINDSICRYLAQDENHHVQPNQVVICNGCQEAMLLATLSLLQDNHVMLTPEVTYIGIIGIGKLLKHAIQPIKTTINGICLDDLVQQTQRLSQQGKKAKLLYIIPDFDNPLGYSLSYDDRITLIEFCARENIWILEDSPYRPFNYGQNKIPSLMALDNFGIVIHIGTFSKIIAPALRLGYMVLPNNKPLIDNLVKSKSFTTVSSSQYLQAVVAGMLSKNNYTLSGHLKPIIAHYQNNYQAMLSALHQHAQQHPVIVDWNQPNGGFFITLKLNQSFTQHDVNQCAKQANVLVMPTQFFALTDRYSRYLRLSFSTTTATNISKAIESFAHYLTQRTDVQ